MSLYNRVGELIFGTRLKRLSDRFLADVSQLYKELDIPFEYSWFPIFWLLDETGTLSVTEIARELEITHSAVSQMVTSLEKKGYIAFDVDENDRRRRLVRLTDMGQELLAQVRPVWQGMHRAMRVLLNEGAHSTDLLDGLSEIELSLDRHSFLDRLMSELDKDALGPVQIKLAENDARPAIHDLLLLWMSENPEADLDEEALNTDTSIQWLLASIEGKAVGLIAIDKSELKYLVVDPAWRHRRIGRQLIKQAVEIARSQGIEGLMVRVPRKAGHAMKLLRELQFKLDTVTSTNGDQFVCLTCTFNKEEAE